MAVFNEDTRVKIPATIQYLRLGYEYQSLKDADIDPDTRIFRNRFKPAIEEINSRSFMTTGLSSLTSRMRTASPTRAAVARWYGMRN